ncbi:hypothetical protein Aab01nite_76870 [Paractinoplanes abujensis]|uniref:PASTA domain-containing protein n=1 Tax=Paractinoplanes abujensis TaxID=882441 RepID=A0A7W7G377_9ACTN|nr:PASTA domain-containing protein [Actinoplanes abujensis]MBB4692426.1 hypothetical protein [Actinoplanes abujensis]GID24097.1 hypothetical protein Aab01nite_76870 [Actinoplanes abujensis]
MSYSSPPPNGDPVGPQYPSTPSDHGWSQPPGYQPPAAYGQPVPPPPAKKKNGKVVLTVVGGVLGLCCFGGVIAAAFGDDDEKATTGVAAPAATLAAEPESVPSSPVITTPPEPATVTTPPKPATVTTPPEPATVTTPPKPATATVPNLRGENAAVAADRLKQLGFTRVEFGSADKGDTWVVLPQNWTVTKQSAKAGTKLALDTLIVLTCTKQG